MTYLLLKDDKAADQIIADVLDEEEEGLNGIRCPRCEWRPSSSSRWCCECVDGPEPPFDGCGMVWNTFSTRGRCPRCSHQWRFTSCLRCHEWSPHDAWYERTDGR